MGHKTICGIDEAGRGAFAGPLVCAAVTLPDSFTHNDFPQNIYFRDSKTLSENQREKAYSAIYKFASEVKTIVVLTTDINRKGIGWANRHGFNRLQLASNADIRILDGLQFKRKLNGNLHFMVRADATIPAVMCAGIVAKVTRDKIMQELGAKYREYGWKENKGYGTSAHRKAIKNLGINKHHRTQFVKDTLTSYYYT